MATNTTSSKTTGDLQAPFHKEEKAEQKKKDPVVQKLEGVPPSPKNTEEKKKSRGRRRKKRKGSKKMEAEGVPGTSCPTRLDEKEDENGRGNALPTILSPANTKEMKMTPRSWFHSLSGEEKAVALSITNKKLIEMFLDSIMNGKLFFSRVCFFKSCTPV